MKKSFIIIGIVIALFAVRFVYEVKKSPRVKIFFYVEDYPVAMGMHVSDVDSYYFNIEESGESASSRASLYGFKGTLMLTFNDQGFVDHIVFITNEKLYASDKRIVELVEGIGEFYDKEMKYAMGGYYIVSKDKTTAASVVASDGHLMLTIAAKGTRMHNNLLTLDERESK